MSNVVSLLEEMLHPRERTIEELNALSAVSDREKMRRFVEEHSIFRDELAERLTSASGITVFERDESVISLLTGVSSSSRAFELFVAHTMNGSHVGDSGIAADVWAFGFVECKCYINSSQQWDISSSSARARAAAIGAPCGFTPKQLYSRWSDSVPRIDTLVTLFVQPKRCAFVVVRHDDLDDFYSLQQGIKIEDIDQYGVKLKLKKERRAWR